MLESLTVDGLKSLTNPQASLLLEIQSGPLFPQTADIQVMDNGRIRLPGFPLGLSIEYAVGAYIPLLQLQGKILEACRVVDRFSPQLRLVETDVPEATSPADQWKAPVTPITSSPTFPHLFYKREDKTVTKAYKVRGALVGMAKAFETGIAQRFLAVSTGNHALGIFKAAELLRPEAVRIVIPHNTSATKLEKLNKEVTKLNQLGVEAIVEKQGETFEAARKWAIANVRQGEYYLDPYSDPWVVAGQGTLGAEILQQLRPIVENGSYEEILLISPIGGGGLLTGTATAMKLLSTWDRAFAGINMRFIGLRLDDINAPLGDAIRVPEIARSNQLALRTLEVEMALMSEDDMQAGVGFVAHDLGQHVEGASGGTLAPVLFRDDCKPTDKRLVVCLLSGGNIIHTPQAAPLSENKLQTA